MIMKRLLYTLAIVMMTLTAQAQDRRNNGNGQAGHGYGQQQVEPGRGHADPGMGMPAAQMPQSQMPYTMPPMDKNEAKMVVDLLKRTSFDDQRLEIAKVILALRPMTAKDIASCVKCFTFASGKKSFAMYAFAFCVDKENAETIEKALTYRSDRDEFRRMVMQYEREFHPGHKTHR